MKGRQSKDSNHQLQSVCASLHLEMFLLEGWGVKTAKYRNTSNIIYVFSILVFSYNKSNPNFNLLLEPSDKEPNVKQPTTH